VKITLFTGAGASRAIAYPLTRDLLPKVREYLVDGTLFEDMSTRS